MTHIHALSSSKYDLPQSPTMCTTIGSHQGSPHEDFLEVDDNELNLKDQSHIRNVLDVSIRLTSDHSYAIADNIQHYSQH